MDPRPLGKTRLNVTPIGFGSFKIGRDQATKYPQAYDLPTDEQAERLLNQMLDLGITYFDTAPAYGLSEQRLGKTLAKHRNRITLSTKVGETFEDGKSTYDFSATAITQSVERSLKHLRTDVIDLLLIHSDGRDLHILNETDAPATLQKLRDRGIVRAIGFSGKTNEGFTESLQWADAIMVEFNEQNQTHLKVMQAAHTHGLGIIVKKALASGHLPANKAIAFALSHNCIDTLVVGGLNASHMRDNITASEAAY